MTKRQIPRQKDKDKIRIQKKYQNMMMKNYNTKNRNTQI